MELTEFGDRIAALRIIKGVSAREMSLSIGLSANYINKIENGITWPSMNVFFYICEYLKITPKDFFDINNSNPSMASEHYSDYIRLDSTSQTHISGLTKELMKNK